MIPGTQRGYNLVVDQKSGLATVFEVAFSGYASQEIAAAAAATPKREPQFKNGQRNREVQRKVWFGYVDGGAAAPTARHTFTNRLEGKGIYWKQDNGIEILEFYLSITFSNFIELTRFGGEMTACAPSDYIMVNDHQFIYSRIECEFSGTFTLQLVDLFDMTQKGVRLGLTDKDALEYTLYSGQGDLTGQIASFEVFGNNGETRGPRRVYRPLETFEVMTDAEVRDQVINHAHAFGDGKGSGAAGMGGYKGELITRFVGKKLTARMDNGPVIEYDFASDNQHYRTAEEIAATHASRDPIPAMRTHLLQHQIADNDNSVTPTRVITVRWIGRVTLVSPFASNRARSSRLTRTRRATIRTTRPWRIIDGSVRSAQPAGCSR